MTTPEPKRRWPHPTPGWLVYASLTMTGLLWLSERFKWFPFNEHKGWTVLIAVAGVGVVLLLLALWFLVALVFRRRFQFSIRSLLVLTVAVALPFSWLAVEMKWAREQEDLVDDIQKAGGSVVFDSDDPNALNAQPWLRTLLGEQFLREVVYVYYGVETADADLARLKRLKRLQALYLANTKVTDAGLESIKGLTQLQALYLANTKVTDAGLESIKGLKQLEFLSLANTKITDSGLESIKGLKQLEGLRLDGTKITDTGLASLKGLTQLQRLWLDGKEITDSGVKKLQQALPKCNIQR
jgi:hypothetical protein